MVATIRTVLVAVALTAVAGCRPSRRPPACRAALDVRDWGAVAARCTGPRWRHHAELGQAWTRATTIAPDEAAALARGLGSTEVAFDALAFAGYVHGRADEPDVEEAGRALLWRAYLGLQLGGRHGAAAYVAGFLSRAPRPTARFDDALRFAELAVTTAEAGRDLRALGEAEIALAEVYDDLGMADEAREAFFRAEERLARWPARLAYAYHKHGTFLDDLGTPDDLRASLRYQDAAEEQARGPAGVVAPAMAEVVFAIHLNRADALAQLGDLDGATRALDLPVANERQRRKRDLVYGFVAARREDLAAAEARFTAAGEADDEYQARVASEIAALHRRAGRLTEAETAYRAAVAAVERLRQAGGGLDLRPWVLARRSRPYVDLLELLVGQDRGADALVVAESLHARSWLDAAVRDARAVGPGALAAYVDAQVRQQGTGEAVLDHEALRAQVGDREALVFLSTAAGSWRAYQRVGVATFTRLSGADLDAARAFRDDPGDPVIAERAAAALIPATIAAGHEPLYIVASGELADLPFAALRRDGRFLIEERPLARLPGLAALTCRSLPWTERRVYIGDARGDLPAAAAEVRRLGGDDAKVGSAATRAQVLDAGAAAILHVAVHGRRVGGAGAIELADGLVTANDIIAAGVAPRLVVLSGCATAASRDAEAWDGFPSAFLATGARHVVATSRTVEDTAAAAFAARFYAQPDGASPIDRVAAAQRAMAVEGWPVASWSAFAVWGVAGCDDASP